MPDVHFGLLWEDGSITNYSPRPELNPPRGTKVVALVGVDVDGGPDRPVTSKSPGTIVKLSSDAVEFLQGMDWAPGMEDAKFLTRCIKQCQKDQDWAREQNEQHRKICEGSPDCPPEWAGTKHERLATRMRACGHDTERIITHGAEFAEEEVSREEARRANR